MVELDESEEARRKIEREKGGGASERERVDDPLGAKSILLCDAMVRRTDYATRRREAGIVATLQCDEFLKKIYALQYPFQMYSAKL